ncbi:MAG: hypothetical protein AABY22_02485, partial [Nanoarchaeota archaeon]
MALPTTNLKALRDYSEHDVLNFFTLAQNSGDAGNLVSLQGSGLILTANQESTALTSQAGVYSHRKANPNKVTLATANQDKTQIIGILL